MQFERKKPRSELVGERVGFLVALAVFLSLFSFMLFRIFT